MRPILPFDRVMPSFDELNSESAPASLTLPFVLYLGQLVSACEPTHTTQDASPESRVS